MLWRVKGSAVEQIEDTAFSKQQLQEKDLEAWLETNPEMLGEPLLIVGRQVAVPGIHDRLDLLALDPNGNTVIIEVKRGVLKDPVDVQALRYASYISRWSRRKIEQSAEAYFSQQADEGGSTNFEEVFADFASDVEDAGVPSLNGKQRIIVVGQRVQAKLGSVALWLLEQGIDIKVVEITPYKDPSGDSLLLNPQIIIPPPSTAEYEVGVGDENGEPWVVDGQKWHLHKRCKAKSRELLLALNERIAERFPDAAGPNWNQKHYVSFRLENANWLALVTQGQLITIHIPVPPARWDTDDLAKRLDIAVFSKEDSLSEKFAAPTSVRVQKRKGRERIIFKVKDQDLLKADDFWAVLNETHDDFLKGW